MSRAYYFGNMYLSSIQQGIQALHCTSEMYLKYPRHRADECERQHKDLCKWGDIDQTVVLLNGGDCSALEAIADHLSSAHHDYAWAEWREGITALAGALTCVGIILPPYIYESAKELRRPVGDRDEELICMDLDGWELELIGILNSCELAS